MYRERVLLGHGFILEVRFAGEARWKLSLRKGRQLLLEYGSETPYDFKSVEQLRYDFERDVENAQRQGR
jgi:hypothetical protein